METTKRQYRLIPTFGDSFGTGWEVMFDNFLRLFLLVIILGLVSAPMNTPKTQFNFHDFDFRSFDPEDFFRWGTFGLLSAFFGLLALLYAFLFMPVIRYGSRMMFLQAVRQEKPEFERLFRGFGENYLSIVLANLLKTALIVLGFFLLIIPGIIIACRLSFVSYLVMDKKLDPIEAVETSWRMTRGHGWRIFMMGFVSFFICIFGLIMLFVGVFPAAIWIVSSFAALYESVNLEKERSAAPVAA
jgi:uncharacterized membrane protein